MGKPVFRSLQASDHRWPLGCAMLPHFWREIQGGFPSSSENHCAVSGYDSKFLQNETSSMEGNQWLKEHLLFLFPRSYNIPHLGFAWVTEKHNWALDGVAQRIERGLQTKASPVPFPVRAHAWVAGQIPSRGCVRGNHTLMFLSLFASFLSKNK